MHFDRGFVALQLEEEGHGHAAEAVLELRKLRWREVMDCEWLKGGLFKSGAVRGRVLHIEELGENVLADVGNMNLAALEVAEPAVEGKLNVRSLLGRLVVLVPA